MKKYLVVVLVLAFVAGLSAQEKPEIVDTKELTVAVMECSGPYSNMSANIGKFMNEFFKQGLAPAGTFSSIYFNSPEEVAAADLKWAVGFPVASGTKVTAPLVIKIIKAGKAVQYLHKGSYSKLHQAYGKVKAFGEKSGYQVMYPVMDQYINNPQNTKPEDLKTLITYPVKKK